MAQLALIADLVTRWHYLHKLQIWQPDSASCISCIFGHQLAQLGLVQNLVIRSCHLHYLVSNLATRLCHLHCLIAVECPIGIIS